MPLNEAVVVAETYEAMTWGDCLGGVVPNGSFVDIDPDQDIHIGNLVSVVMKPAGSFDKFARWLENQDLLGVFKIFLGSQVADDGETVFVFGQLNPPLIAPIPKAAVEAMHLIVSVKPAGERSGATDEADDAALRLLGPFFQRGGPVAPINPMWRPPE